MTALQVREFPDELYEQLKEYAASQHRSIAQQTIVAVERMLSEVQNAQSSSTTMHASGWNPRIISFDTEANRQARIAKRQALFAEIATLPKMEIPDDFPSIVELIHEARDERDHQMDELLGLSQGEEEQRLQA